MSNLHLRTYSNVYCTSPILVPMCWTLKDTLGGKEPCLLAKKKSGRCSYWLTGAKAFVIIGLKFPWQILLLAESSWDSCSYWLEQTSNCRDCGFYLHEKAVMYVWAETEISFFSSRYQYVKKGNRMSIAGVRDHYRTQGTLFNSHCRHYNRPLHTSMYEQGKVVDIFKIIRFLTVSV